MFKSLSRVLIAGTILSFGIKVPCYAQKPMELEFNNWLPSTHVLAINAYEPWKKMVEEKTAGRVKVNLYHGGVLGQGKSSYQDIKGGVYDVGLVIPTYYYDTDYFKLLVVELPFALSDGKIGTKVLNEFIKRDVKGLSESLGVKFMGGVVIDPYEIFSRKPIRTLEDMKGVRLRVPGKSWVESAKEWGAIPTPVTLENSYTALDHGTIDVIQFSLAGAQGYKFYEKAPYITKIGSPVILSSYAMNQKFFNKLPADLQKLFEEELNPALADLAVQTYARETPLAYQKMEAYFKKTGKGEIITLSPEERAKFIAPTKSMWDEWVAEANKRGLPGDKLIADYKEILKQNGIKPPF